MYLKRLELTHFRNYTRSEIDLPARINVVQGENAQGKTNLLEAIYYLATTRSSRASTDRQLIQWSARETEVIPYARVTGVFERSDEEHTIESTLTLEPRESGAPDDTVFRRQIRVDGVARRAMDVVGRLTVVLFLPEDITLVSGSPGDRRRYLDITLCQIDTAYCRALSRYGRIMRQRNALLRRIGEGAAEASELAYWDEQLVKLGALVLARRYWAMGELGRRVREIQPALTAGAEKLALSYENSIAEKGGLPPATIDALASMQPEALTDVLRRALRAVRREEIARGVTVIGPHRDDLRFLLNGADATIYGSRGQQRTVALGLKLAETDFMAAEMGEMPVLLLDDVMSELDERRGQLLLARIQRAQQVLLTTTRLSDLSDAFLERAVLWRVVNGTIARAEA
jgi:DNA replication and repair protein RecF